jgi:hypothetical protein
MGELLNALNAAGTGADASHKSASDQAADLFRAASQRVNEAIETARKPGMPLDRISRWTRQMPLQALAVVFLIGVMTVRRSRPDRRQ